ncbi:MAG TPA: phenylalanine--tRNA ligase subunit beta [Anaerolineae bacterium]|nr:phenylalanine--tRNA ligase subunit beta [Anaerolineae bacterium]
MRVPFSWLQDFVKIDISIEEIARRLTMAGLEVEEVQYVGLPLPSGKTEGRAGGHSGPETKTTGLAWEPDKIVVGSILEVMSHPNADRLVLCRLDDGEQEHTLVTGAPNLFPFKDKGALSHPLKVAYAREGARIFDGHSTGQELTTLKRAEIRGVESYSMACSEKELGISDDHEGVILLDEDAPTGTPLVDYMGDAVFDIAVKPNTARVASILGVARELAALTGAKLKEPSYNVTSKGSPIETLVEIEIQEPELNPRFVLGYIEGIATGPSPYWMQRRLTLAGMRPINCIVDATNYVMLEIGEPLHAFDYDALASRTEGAKPKIITRLPESGESLTTLDGEQRQLDDFTVLVCDTAGPLSIAGVIGGAETEVGEQTKRVLLEGAAWDFINIRRTLSAQRIDSEASYRFSRGVHPAMADRAVRRALELMRSLTGGTVAQGLIDAYPLPPKDPVVEITPEDVQRWLGIDLKPKEMAEILRRLQFEVETKGNTVHARTPDHRLDIGEGNVGKADLMEEIARQYGYDRIPETLITDELPPLYGNPDLVLEERVRDLLVSLGLQEVITYRLTSIQREARHLPPASPRDDKPYVHLANPITSDRVVMRHSLLASVLEIVERNAHVRDRIALFEIGPVFLGSEEGALPDEVLKLVIALTGPRALPTWQDTDEGRMDFFDLKGILVELLKDLHLENIRFEPHEHPSFHPGKCARVMIADKHVGYLGEIHPLVRENYDLPETPLMAADMNLQTILAGVPERYDLAQVPTFPPVLEDLAIVVEEELRAQEVEDQIRSAGGSMLVDVRLFDLYRGDQIGAGKKSLAYALTYQAPDRTLTDEEVAKVRGRIIKHLEKKLKSKLRS